MIVNYEPMIGELVLDRYDNVCKIIGKLTDSYQQKLICYIVDYGSTTEAHRPENIRQLSASKHLTKEEMYS